MPSDIPPSGPDAVPAHGNWAAENLPVVEGCTAVDGFADYCSGQEPEKLRGLYQTLLPATPPGPGEQYAFEVDLDRCSGCKSCVVACHALNGLDEQESWREVGLLVGGGPDLPVLQHVTTACHHCLEPACQAACPVNAYQKDPGTGIVIHLDDQCFGCRYCTLACPYDVPKYHAAKGIVRKCDMCRTRLLAGEAPACVQACPHQAIRIRVVATHQIREAYETHTFLPGTPDPQLTEPTTVYTTRKVFPRNMLPADYYHLRPAEAHWPLVIMLILTQMSVGTLLTGQLLQREWGVEDWQRLAAWPATWSLLMGLVALAASTLHLGRPWLCFRAVLGLSHSWLSREIVAFGMFALLALVHAAATWGGLASYPLWLGRLAGTTATCVGLAAVVSSAMVYAATKRALWNGPSTVARFLLSTLLLGSVTTWWLTEVSVSITQEPSQAVLTSGRRMLATATISLTGLKLLYELSLLRYLRQPHHSALKRSAQLLIGPLGDTMLMRLACGVAGGLLLPALSSKTALLEELGPWGLLPLTALLMATVSGEIFERYLFFTTCVVRRMPGAVQS
ncbi:MAG: molybdopterin oxidoreductase [Pirellulaceae bacterium]|nr:MAG: molybdopterin oxidoreductase [Pirellulaceae bacterium]